MIPASKNREPPEKSRLRSGATKRRRRTDAARLACFALFLAATFTGVACNVDERRNAIPPEAQAAIERLTDDIAAGRDGKIYEEAAEEWRSAVTPEQNGEILEGVRRLGRVESRTYHTGVERQYGAGAISGHTLDVRYETSFQRATGMETFTLVERDGRWLLARYSVNALKQ